MIKNIIIRGERCSGTNYLRCLINQNINIDVIDLGWKHSYLNIFDKKLVSQNDYLVIFIFRNPVDWVKSLYNNTWHFEKKHKKVKNIDKFIRYEQKQVIRGLSEFKEYDPNIELYWERHPFTLEKPKNICQLRNWKNENFLSCSNIFENVEYIKYEDLVVDPKMWIDYLNKKYFNLEYNFNNVDYYKGDKKQGLFNKNVYDKLSVENIEFIRDNLDWSIEEKIGYFEYNLEKYNK
jgi:hypothetical protein